MSKLTPRQQRFVDEYLIDLNATQASIRAGYSKKTAEQQGPRLLGNVGVASAISAAQAKRAARVELKQDRVLQELARIAFFDPRRLFRANGEPLEINELDDDVAAVVAGIDIVLERTDEGRNAFSSVRKYKLADKLGALQAAMRHLGMMKDRVELTGKGGGPVQHQNIPVDLSKLTDEELAGLEGIVAKLGNPPAAGGNSG